MLLTTYTEFTHHVKSLLHEERERLLDVRMKLHGIHIALNANSLHSRSSDSSIHELHILLHIEEQTIEHNIGLLMSMSKYSLN